MMISPQGEARYAELTYSSFDDGVSGGGWQIKQTRGRLSHDELQGLRSQATTQLDAGVELPRFPTPEEISRFPRRLAYTPAGPPFDAGAAVWSHTVGAGSDASGRPGNVFCHLVLDRTPLLAPTFRPIDLWRSSSWLTPYGAEQVAAAELSPRLPELGNAFGVDQVIDFCFADFDRIAVLGPLLDACAAALAGGAPVILAVSDPEQAARWVATVSRLTAAISARELYFSTLERHGGLADAIRRGQRLICIPAGDLDAADHDRRRLDRPTVLLSEDEFPELGDLGGPDEPAHPHVTDHGDTIAVTPWSGLARTVLEAEAPGQARAALERIDPIAELVAQQPDAHYSPDWPLAMAVALSGDVFVDAHSEAALVIGRSSPATLDRIPELYGPAAQLIATRCGTSTADAWTALRNAAGATGTDGSDRAGSSIGSVLIFDSYLRRALVDHDWLVRPQGVPLPKPMPAVDRSGLAAVAADQVAALSRASGTANSMDSSAIGPARLADLMIRTGLADDTTIGQLIELVRPLTGALITDAGTGLVEQTGPLQEETMHRVIRPAVVLDAPAPQTLGHRLPASVLGWLYPQPPQPIALRAVYDQQRSGTLPADYWLRAEYDWARIVGADRATVDAGEVGFATWAMLDAGERAGTSTDWLRAPAQPVDLDWDACLPLLRSPLDPDDLYCLIHRYEPSRSIATRATAATLLTVGWTGNERSAELQRLCRRLQQRDRRDPDPIPDADLLPQVREWLADRSWASAWWASRTATMINTINSWSRRSGFPDTSDYAADIRSGMAAVLIIELLNGRPASAVSQLLSRFGPDRIVADRDVTETVAAVINSSEAVRRDHPDQAPKTVIGPTQLLAAVLHGDRNVLDGRLSTQEGRWLSGFRTRRREPLLESLLISWLRRVDDRQLRRVREQTVTLLLRTLSAADNRKDVERAVAGKVKELRKADR